MKRCFWSGSDAHILVMPQRRETVEDSATSIRRSRRRHDDAGVKTTWPEHTTVVWPPPTEVYGVFTYGYPILLPAILLFWLSSSGFGDGLCAMQSSQCIRVQHSNLGCSQSSLHTASDHHCRTISTMITLALTPPYKHGLS